MGWLGVHMGFKGPGCTKKMEDGNTLATDQLHETVATPFAGPQLLNLPLKSHSLLAQTVDFLEGRQQSTPSATLHTVGTARESL